MIKHQNDAQLDKKVTVFKDDENIEFEGLPMQWAFDLEVQFKT